MTNYLERYEDQPIRDFKPATGMCVVYMADDGGFRIEASPGYLVFDKSDGYGIEVVAAALAQNGMPYVPVDNVGVFPDDKARQLFEDAKWSFYLSCDPDDIEVIEKSGGQLKALVEYKKYVTKGGESWELHCPEDALPYEIRDEIENLREDAIERYQLHQDVRELTAGLGTVEE